MALAFQEELLERYTDLELAHYIASSPSCTSSSRVFNLSSNLIAKIYRTSEVEDALKATEVASQLGIRYKVAWRKIMMSQDEWFDGLWHPTSEIWCCLYLRLL